jgi:hypothetical protein
MACRFNKNYALMASWFEDPRWVINAVWVGLLD